MIFGNTKQEIKGPQEVVVSWGTRDHQQTMLYSSLFQVASRLTEVWFAYGKKPESPDEIVETFTKMYQPLDEWYNGGPIKADLQRMLDTLYPDPVGYEPGQTLLERMPPPAPGLAHFKGPSK